jgi:hypothetical protein
MDSARQGFPEALSLLIGGRLSAVSGRGDTVGLLLCCCGCGLLTVGRSGEVYSATDVASNAKVAIKIDKEDGNPALMKWEAEVLNDLQSRFVHVTAVLFGLILLLP